MKIKSLLSKKIVILLIVLGMILLYLAIGFYNPLTVTEYSFTSSKIPDAFDGFRIIHISDFHCKDFGYQEEDLIQAVRDATPDIIVFTGDSIDGDHTIDNYAYLLEGIHDIAPIYYINGNHEYDRHAPSKEFAELHKKYDVTDLNDRTELILRSKSYITLSGLDFRSTMQRLRLEIEYADPSTFSILLYHGTDKFDGIAPYNYNLVLTGHTHGGIICLPFIGGIISNRKELFPKYDSGNFTVGASTMISSRGLGDASIPRFYNPREVVCITLHTATNESDS